MAPLGFQVFCLKNPSQCRSAGKAEIAYDASVLSALEGVNRRVNRAINYKSDGRRDTWSLNVSRGDCEDYVLAKRKRLVEGGMPASALRIAYVKTNRGIDHAILIVKTSDGDLVLDNLTNRIKPFEQTGLRMVAMSSSDPMRWTAY